MADQVLPGVQRWEEDQLVHPGRSVNTLFTFLRQPECWDEPKAAFLRQRPDQAPAPPPLRQASPAEKRGPSPCGRPLAARAVTAPSGSLQFALEPASPPSFCPKLPDSRPCDSHVQLHSNVCNLDHF